jgi:WD40 repeat protein
MTAQISAFLWITLLHPLFPLLGIGKEADSSFLWVQASNVAASSPPPASTTEKVPPVTAVAWHPSGKTSAVAIHQHLRLCDSQGQMVGPVPRVSGRITSVHYDPLGRWLAVAHGESGRQSLISLFALTGEGRLANDQPFVILEGHRDSIYALSFHPQGKLLASAGYDRDILLWEIPDPDPQKAQHKQIKPVRVLKDHSDVIYGLAFHPQGKLLASAGADRAVKVWRVEDGQRLYTLGEMTDWVYCVAWHPDGRHLAAGGVDKTIRLWMADEKGGKLLASVYAHEKPVWRLAFHRDGQTLYSVGEEGIIKIWDVPRLVERRVLAPQVDTVLDLAVHPQQPRLLLGRYDGRALIIDDAGRPVMSLWPQPPQPPQVSSVTPAAVHRSQKVHLTVRGQYLEHLREITVNPPAIQLHWKPAVAPCDTLVVEAIVSPQAPVGVVTLRFTGVTGASTQLPLIVDHFPSVAEQGTGDALHTAETVRLPVTVAGSVDRPGDEDFYRFDASAGEEIGVEVVTGEIGSKLEAVLTLQDAQGQVVAEGERYLGYTIPRAGTYVLSIRDRQYRGGKEFTYRLHIGPIPVITGVFPLSAPRGKTTTVQVKGVHLGQPQGWHIPVTIPAEAPVGSTWEIPLPMAKEKPRGKATLIVDQLEGKSVDPNKGVELALGDQGMAADGILLQPQSSQTIRFHARQGETWIVEVLARRAGSPLDPVIEIRDAADQLVPHAILRPTSVFYTTHRDHEATAPGIRLESWNDLAIDDYLYAHGELMRVLALPRNPDDDCQFYQFQGRRLAYLGTTPAVHYQGTPLYKVEIHPPGRTFPPNGLPLFTLYYRNDDGGPEYGKDSYLRFTAPSTGVYSVRVSDARGAGGPNYAYRLRIRRPQPDFAIQFSPTRPVIWKGGAASITVEVTRRDGFDGRVWLQFVDLPPGFSSPPTFIEAGQFTTAVTLAAAPDAQLPPQFRFKLLARAQIDGREVTREAWSEPLGPDFLRPPSDLVCRPRVQSLTIRPGQETRFIVDIERLGNFRGRVPLEVRGLPHGVRVLNVGLNGILITERETSREVVLYAEPWVQPMQHPIVVLARHEGKGTEHAAPALLLKVEK